ncbi:MAG TPA: integrase [Bacteroidales bacterium]|nr:integrase [Bacteroidales bacterium]
MQVLNSYLNYLQFEKHYSIHTFISYKTDILQFFQFLKIDEQNATILHKVTNTDIREWIISLGDQNLTNRSINRKITTIKGFFKYCLRENIIPEDPTKTITSLKTAKPLPVYVEERAMNEMLDDDDIFDDNFSGYRDKMIISLFYLTGIRKSELINLKENDINFTDNTIKVTGKRNKERIIPILPSFSEKLQKYLKFLKNTYGNTPYIFITDKGHKLYPKLVYRIVNKYLSKVSTIKKKSPHVIRHTFATHMLNNGADLNAIKELLGHANLAATQIYTHNSFEQLKKTYYQTHPRN